VNNRRPAPFAVFFELQLLRLLLLIHRRRVVAPLAVGANQSNNIGHEFKLPFPESIPRYIKM
jgi:hypothetical protein